KWLRGRYRSAFLRPRPAGFGFATRCSADSGLRCLRLSQARSAREIDLEGPTKIPCWWWFGGLDRKTGSKNWIEELDRSGLAPMAWRPYQEKNTISLTKSFSVVAKSMKIECYCAFDEGPGFFRE